MLNVTLVVIGGATEGEEFQLSLPAILGRSREASIALPHPLVSRLHCELSEREDRLIVRDLGSTNGTFVGSERVDESVVEHGALLTIGTVTFRAHYQGWPVHFEPDFPHAPETQADTEALADSSTITRIDTGSPRGTPTPAHRSGQRAK